MSEKIAVLCGGDGREREVSLNSGKAVCKALCEAGFDAEVLDLHSLNEIEEKIQGYSKAFIAMHGDWGEDGKLQKKLGDLKIPYTGSGPQASALAMNKYKARELFKKTGINVPDGFLFDENNIPEIKFKNIVVKPNDGGSTVGISIIKDFTIEKLKKAVETAKENYSGDDVLIEEYIEGREITVSVWENDGITEALPIIEIKPKTGFYDYKNKYTSGATQYIVPAEIEKDIAEKISEASIKAHEILGCKAYSRADFRLNNNGNFYILEVNTAPGMTATSLVPKAAKANGISMPEFVKKILLMSHL